MTSPGDLTPELAAYLQRTQELAADYVTNLAAIDSDYEHGLDQAEQAYQEQRTILGQQRRDRRRSTTQSLDAALASARSSYQSATGQPPPGGGN